MALRLYTLENGQLLPLQGEATAANCEGVIWFDLCEPTDAEERMIESCLGIEIPTRDEMGEIESSSRFYQEKGAVYASGVIISKSDTVAPLANVISFILFKQRLVTVRYADPYSFRIAATNADEERLAITSGYSVLINLLESGIARLADIIENAGHGLDSITHALFRPTIKEPSARLQAKPDYEDMIRQIGVYGDLFSKTQESLLSMSRLVSFVAQAVNPKFNASEQERASIMLKDMSALGDHVNFLSNKINFLLDATLGMINIEQSGIIKIFSVAAVVFLPPTLVASIYGMNFEHMPELKWLAGYPVALVLMILSALLPYFFFKRKKWL